MTSTNIDSEKIQCAGVAAGEKMLVEPWERYAVE
jgi:hypothetical protein